MFHNGFLIMTAISSSKSWPRNLKDNLSTWKGTTERYTTFWIPIKKENKNVKIKTYRLTFFEGVRIMMSSLSSLAHNPVKGSLLK